MELSTYFTNHQRLTLKSLWIPGIILVVLGIIPCFYEEDYYHFRTVHQDAFSLSFLITTLKWSVAYGWAPLIRKAYKKAVLIIIPLFVLNLKIKLLFYSLLPFLPPIIDTAMIMILWGCLQVIYVCYISGEKNFWQTGLVAGLFITYLSDVPVNPLGYIRFEAFSLLNMLADFCLPFLIYGWIYLAENFFNNKDYKEILNSKIQVISSKEYQFLFPLVAISCWTMIFQSVSLLKTLSQGNHYYTGFSNLHSSSVLTNAVTFMVEISIFYISANLLRNIVISRMNTIANHNGWMYLLHFIPVANIFAWISFSKKQPVHNTKSENALFYTANHDTAIRNYLIGIGVLFAIGDLYGAYENTRIETSPATGMIVLLMFAKLVNFFFLDRGKNAVVSLIVFGCLGSLAQVLVLASAGRYVSSLTLAIVLAYFFWIEIFHPELAPSDAAELPAPTSGV
ncbi:hypothetical protein [Chitinophaga sancti]|uniref:hypothetical protein n=1 Tax=Chitinophaga sancti TaxID=1004 RepID=UPI003F791317